MPQVIFAVQDGNLGILPSLEGEPLVVVGASSAGVVNAPVVCASVPALVDAAGYGDAPTMAANAINAGQTVLFVKTAATTAGVPGAVDSTGKTGTSAVTVTGQSVVSTDIWVKFTKGGTIAAAGIEYQVSRDGGYSYDPPKALGTANTITVDKSGIIFNLDAGTIIAGDVVKIKPVAPEPTDAEVLAALQAAHAHEQSWDLIAVVATASATMFDVVSTFENTATLQGRPCSAFLFTRKPTAGESESDYRTALNTAFAGKASTYIELCAGDCYQSSGIDSARMKVPAGWSMAVKAATLEPHLPVSMPAHGGLPVSIREKGILVAHDEQHYPGLGTDRFSVLTSYFAVKGVHAHRSQLFSPTGSDFDLHVHRRVLNKALRTVYVPMVLRLMSPVPVNAETGFVREDEASEWDTSTQTLLESIMLAKPWVSAVSFRVSRTDNLLSTKIVNATLLLTPLGYPDVIKVNVAFRNPALQVQV